MNSKKSFNNNNQKNKGGQPEKKPMKPQDDPFLQDIVQQIRSLIDQIPRDEEDPQYVHAFTIDQTQEILNFFQKFGFVVVRNVLTPQECQNTLDDIFGLLESESTFRRNNIDTWDAWPENGMKKHGMPTRAPVFTKATLANRQNKNVHKVFSLIQGTDQLLVNHDRVGFQRPTKDVMFSDGVQDDCPHWKTASNLHMDMDPFGYAFGNKAEETLSNLRYGYKLNHFIFENNQINANMFNGLHLQAVINMCDNYEEDGGFQIVPGFPSVFDSWVKQYRNSDMAKLSGEKNSLLFPDENLLQKVSIRIPMRAGSMVLWDQRSPHGARSNRSSRFRCAQFLRMYPDSPIDPERARARASTVWNMIKKAGFEDQVSEVGQVVFGLKYLNQNAAQNVNNNSVDNNNNNQQEEDDDNLQDSMSDEAPKPASQPKSQRGGRIQGRKW